MMPVVSKLYCSSSDEVLFVRRRPNVANGGGFAVTDANQTLVFTVDGCGVIGRKSELILRDGDGNSLLLIRRKGSIVEALTLTKRWKGSTYDFTMGSQKLVFTLKEPNSCLSKTNPIRVSMESRECVGYGYFEVRGDFPGKRCSIVDSTGNAIALIGARKEMVSRDLYDVEIRAGIDQAFVFGVIGVLDYIHDGSTRC